MDAANQPSTRGPRSVDPRRRTFALAVAVMAGAALAIQARLNGEFAARLGDGIMAALLTTIVGLVALLLLVPILPANRRGVRLIRSALRTGELRWWHCCGGISGGLFVASQGVSVGLLGVAVFTVAVVGGTVVGSLAADKWGLGPNGRDPITLARVSGAVLCIGAVAITGRDWLSGHGALVLVVLPIVAGLGIAVQSAFNARVGAIAESSWSATLVNFVVAGTTLALASAVVLIVRGIPAGGVPTDPWLYAAGFLGIGAVAGTIFAVRYIGVLVFGLASVAGQLLCAVIIDTVNPDHQPSVATWLGTVVTFLAVLLVTVSSRSRAQP